MCAPQRSMEPALHWPPPQLLPLYMGQIQCRRGREKSTTVCIYNRNTSIWQTLFFILHFHLPSLHSWRCFVFPLSDKYIYLPGLQNELDLIAVNPSLMSVSPFHTASIELVSEKQFFSSSARHDLEGVWEQIGRMYTSQTQLHIRDCFLPLQRHRVQSLYRCVGAYLPEICPRAFWNEFNLAANPFYKQQQQTSNGWRWPLPYIVMNNTPPPHPLPLLRFRFFFFFFVPCLLLWLCDVCDLESHCATHIQMLFKSLSAHLHVKLRIWSQVVCILISGTIFSKVVALKLQMNGTWMVSTIGVARHQLTYCTLLFHSCPSPSSSNDFKSKLGCLSGQCSDDL